MQTKLAVPIAAQNMATAHEQIKAAVAAGAEMLELRVDYLEGLSVRLVQELLAGAKKASLTALPIIVTCRDSKEGGAREYEERLRIDVLLEALRAGTDFIDVEFANFVSPGVREQILAAMSAHPKARLILSAHDFRGRFRDISKVFRDISAAYPAAIPKLVYTANHINDCFEGFDLLTSTSGERMVWCMGEAGLISRIVAKKLNTFVSFASIDEGTATAAGQLTVKEFKQLYRWDSITPKTELFGVIGTPIAHSLSPAIHNACFAELGLDKLYLPLLVDGGEGEFSRFMDNILARSWLDFRGLSVTIPHKQHALDYVRANGGSVEPLAERIGAINTVLIGRGIKLRGYNTDYAGALDAVTAGMGIGRDDLRDLPVAVVGAGGVARAIVAGLRDVGAQVTIYNRTVVKAEKLAGEFECAFAGLDELPKLQAKLLINCTSVGMHPDTDAGPVPESVLKKDMVVFDTVYNPAETLLLRQAKQAGAKTIDGVSMFVNQAAAQFRLLTNTEPNPQLMREVVHRSFTCG
jgi:3-dehydroquinate dehydratase/shikimate dehydrogenase